MKKLIIPFLLFISVIARGQEPGVFNTYFRDDFSQDYEELFWFVQSGATGISLEKDHEAKELEIIQNKSEVDYQGLGVTFSQSINLTYNSTLSLQVYNPNDQAATILIGLIDSSGKIGDIQGDPQGNFESVYVNVPPNKDTILEVDLKGLKTGPWLCDDDDCPFDMSAIKTLNFIVNGVDLITTFTGSLYIKDVTLGANLCGGFPKPVSGPSVVCTGTVHSYSIPVDNEATSYEWLVPDGAMIQEGAGTNSIEVVFGENVNGHIQVTPVFECGEGVVSSIEVRSESPLQGGAATTVNNQICGNSTDVSFSIPSLTGANYAWYAANAQITTDTTQNSVLADLGNESSAQIAGYYYNKCGSGDTTIYNVSLIPAPYKPVLRVDSSTLSIANDSLFTSSQNEYQWSKFGSPIESATNKTLEITESGEYSLSVNNAYCSVTSEPVFAKLSSVVGVGETYAKDDFSSPGLYVNEEAIGSLAWYSGTPYSLVRIGDGKLQVNCSDADLHYESFGVRFNVAEGTSLDLSQNANVHFIVENPSDHDISLWVYMADTLGHSTQVLADTSNGYQYTNVIIPAGSSQTVDFDFTDTYTTEWFCDNDCPDLVDNFDFSAVKQVYFAINKASDTPAEPELFNGTVYLKDLLVGNFIKQDGNTLTAVKGTAYQWQKDGQDLIQETKQTFTAQSVGDYSVKVTDVDGTVHTSRPLRVAAVSGTRKELSSGLSVFPIPASGELNVSLPNGEQADKIEIYNTMGEKLIETKAGQVNVSQLPPAVYILKIEKGGQQVTKRFTKQ